MQLYKENKWRRNYFLTLLEAVRDFFIFILPVERLPIFIIKILYGVSPKFIFFIHPRRKEDVYIAFPLLGTARKLLGKSLFLKFLKYFPPVVLDKIKFANEKILTEGLVISSPFLPEILIKNPHLAIKEILRSFSFARKISCKRSVFGLGGLWPMLTKNGYFLLPYAKKHNIIITTGHTCTLISIFLMVKKIARLANISLDKFKVAILGTGRMGISISRILYGRIAAISLVDINKKRLDKAELELKRTIANTDIYKFLNTEEVGGIKKVFRDNHLVICTTSNVTRILRNEDIPFYSIVIDDSRPEGIPRLLERNRVVLEGGILKIKGLKHNYDFGFGVDENVFGCLAESILLSIDKLENISPTIGSVSYEGFVKMYNYCKEMKIEVGDFKSKNNNVPDDLLIHILSNKTHINSTIPFKNICWLLKVEDIEYSLRDPLVYC